jgi:hypothetical protein
VPVLRRCVRPLLCLELLIDGLEPLRASGLVVHVMNLEGSQKKCK